MRDLPQEFDRNYVLENYLQTQALSESNAGNAGVDGRRVNKRALKEDPSNKVIPAVKDELENTPPKFIPINEATYTPRQKSMLATPKSVAAESCVTSSFCVTFFVATSLIREVATMSSSV